MTSEQLEHKAFVSAAAAVYAWVSAADGVISSYEIDRFVNYLGSLDYVDEISDTDFQEMYVSLLEAFRKDFDDGKSRSIVRLEAFKDLPDKAADLLRLARQALAADHNLDEAEVAAILEIANLLGVDESSLAASIK